MKHWIWISLVVVVLVLFFWPKPSDDYSSVYGMVAPGSNLDYIKVECGCVGFEYDTQPNLADVGHSYNCAGIPTDCKCIRVTGVAGSNQDYSEEEINC